MACRDFEERLLGYHELAIAERQAVDTHMADCPECVRFFTALDKVDWALEERFRRVAPGADLEESVFAASRRIPRFKPPSVLPVLLDFAAAAAMLLVGVLLLTNAGAGFGTTILR